MLIKKIISGGQTGADMGGLLASEELGIESGGWATLGYRTERGFERELLKSFGLKEAGIDAGYSTRTKWNVRDSDGTLLIADKPTSRGSSLTIHFCKQFSKPYIINPNKDDFLEWIRQFHIEILNVAGNRESVSPGIRDKTRAFLVEALS